MQDLRQSPQLKGAGGQGEEVKHRCELHALRLGRLDGLHHVGRGRAREFDVGLLRHRSIGLGRLHLLRPSGQGGFGLKG